MPNDETNSAQPDGYPEATYEANRSSRNPSDTDTASEGENDDSYNNGAISNRLPVRQSDFNEHLFNRNQNDVNRILHHIFGSRLVAYTDSSSEDESDGEGLTLDRIKKFNIFNADQKTVDEGCAICIDGVEINKLMIILDCNHVYCSECIRKWFEKKVTCPECRNMYTN